MNNIIKPILVSIGLSLITISIIGNNSKNTKYFYLEEGYSKREITEYEFNSCKKDYRFKFITAEESFNLEKGVIYGLFTLGASMIFIGVIKSKNKSK